MKEKEKENEKEKEGVGGSDEGSCCVRERKRSGVFLDVLFSAV